MPEDDPKQRRANIEKAKAQIDWEPKVELKVGLTKMVEFYKNGL